MHISEGKRKGLNAVSNGHGVIAALAIDQRGALRKLFSSATGTPEDQIPREQMEQYKQAVSRILTPYASAILLDPEIGLEAAKQRAANSGLLLAYEQTGYDKRIFGRLPRLLEGWSVRRLVEQGANGIKTLLYYSPFSPPETNKIKYEWVEGVGAECVAADVPYFLELVSYHDEMDEKGRDFALLKPETVSRSVAEFSKDQYQVDILKVGVPVNMAFVEGLAKNRNDVLYTRIQAATHFRAASAAASKPFIYLSEGVSNELFAATLELAAEAGATFSGVLCGRATWKDGVAVFAQHGMEALEAWLRGEGAQNIQRVNGCLQKATPWWSYFDQGSGSTPAARQGRE
jgi:tagatose 1,6-diphosphate aldolase